jgi:sarcosine oxidase
VTRTQVIVVGLGAMGSAVCRQLAARQTPVIGIDRHRPPHAFGSTHGDTRITRLSIAEGAHYTPLAQRSHTLWRELEAETGAQLMHQVGVLMISTPGSAFMTTVSTAAARFGIAHEMLDAAALRDRFGMFAVGDDAVAYLEPEGGYLRPEAAVAAQLTAAARDGATLRVGTVVTEWSASPQGVQVRLADGETIAGERLVLSAGPWLPQLLGARLASRFAVHRQLLFWFETIRGHEQLSRMPSWIYDYAPPQERPGAAHGRMMYGFPAIDGPSGGLKLGIEQYETRHLPDDVQHPASQAEVADAYRRHVGERLPWLGPRAVRTASCHYTCTPDSHFVIDLHPEFDNVTIVSPCSGHGFKHSAAIGEAVARQLAGEGPASGVELAPFALSRLL